jgi:hypothetical protein
MTTRNQGGLAAYVQTLAVFLSGVSKQLKKKLDLKGSKPCTGESIAKAAQPSIVMLHKNLMLLAILMARTA